MTSLAKYSLVSLFSIATISSIASCTWGYQDPNKYHAKPSKDMELVTGVKLAQLNQGYAIYKQQCSKCHEPKLPGAIPSKTWHKLIPGMAWNAGLTNEEEKQLNTYIIAASRFIEKEYEH